MTTRRVTAAEARDAAQRLHKDVMGDIGVYPGNDWVDDATNDFRMLASYINAAEAEIEWLQEANNDLDTMLRREIDEHNETKDHATKENKLLREALQEAVHYTVDQTYEACVRAEGLWPGAEDWSVDTDGIVKDALARSGFTNGEQEARDG